MDHAHDLARIKRDLYEGNGHPPLVREHQRMRQQQEQIVRDLYHNPDTGEAGIVSEVHGMRDDMRKALWWVRGGVAVITTAIGVAAWALSTFMQ